MSKLKHDIKSFVPDSIVAIIRIIENKGFDVYIVGGAIRDILLGRYPTSMIWRQMRCLNSLKRYLIMSL